MTAVTYSELQPLACTCRGNLRKEVSVMIAIGMTQILKISPPRGIPLQNPRQIGIEGNKNKFSG
jgi:hypothetical protein